MNNKICAVKHGQGTLHRRLLAVLIAGCFGSAAANPIGPQVLNGQAGFNTQGNVLTVTNTPGAIINWQGFSINAGELTRFIQQNANSTVLNRVTGGDPTQILGALQSNGRVFLVNPNGILFGQGAKIDVNGLVASTLGISNDDFIKGKWNFQAGDKAGSLKNQGAITTPAGGQIVLIAPNVENSGIITSPKGDVVLASGHSVQLVDTMNPDLQVVISAPEHEAVNLGKIITQGGRTGIYGALVKQRGLINADSAVVGENGKVVLKASRDTLLEAGSVTTAKGAGKGGDVSVLGERVGVLDDARIDVSGNVGGGTVLVGGDYQGSNATVLNAKMSHVSAGATIKADAIENGDGGKVVVWADDTTRVYGKISARGGSQAGNGGFVETSGRRYLDIVQAPDVSAPMGKGGNWLLDPENITISSSSDSNISATPAGNPNTFTPNSPGNSSIVNTAAIKTAINTGSTVTIDTNGGGTGAGNIVVDSSASIDLTALTAGAGAKLILNADNDITINSSIINSGNPLVMNFTANANGTATTGKVTLGANVELQPKNGSVTISSKGDITLSAGAKIGDYNYDTGNFTLTSSAGAIGMNSSAIISNGGTITLKAGGSGGITTTGTGAGPNNKFLQGAYVALDSAGPITINKFDGSVVARSTGTGSAISLTDEGGLVVYGTAISGVPAGITTNNGNINLEAAQGMLLLNGPAYAGTGGNVYVKADVTTYGVVAGANVTGAGIYINTSDAGIAGNGVLSANNLYLQYLGGTGPIGTTTTPLKTSSPSGAGNANIQIGYSGSGPSAVYLNHTGDLTFTQAILKAAAAVPFEATASGSLAVNSNIAANGGNIKLDATTGDVSFVGPNGAISTNSTAKATVTATNGAIRSDSNTRTVITAPNLILKAGTGIKGPTPTEQFVISASKLDVKNGANNAVIKNTGGLTLADLDTDTYALYQPSTGYIQVTDDTSLTVANKVVAPNATLSLNGSGIINVNNTVSARSVAYMADALSANAVTTVDGTLGVINIGPSDLTREIVIASSDPTSGLGLWIDSASLANKFVGNTFAFGVYDKSGSVTGAANSGGITISEPIAGSLTTFKNLVFLSKGTVTQGALANISLPSIYDATPCSGCGELGLKGGITSGGTFVLNVANNAVDYFWGYGDTIKFKNAKSLSASTIKAIGGPIDMLVAGNFTSSNGIYSKGGDVTIKTTGGTHDIYIAPPGIHGCDSATTCTSTVKLDATGSVQVPLIEAGTSVDIKAGVDVIDGDGSANNIVSGSGSALAFTYTVGGNISMDAWGATVSGTAGGTANIRTSAPISSGGGGGGVTTPTLDQCVVNPTQSGCSTVLPNIDSCVSTPTQAGCSAVLPTVDSCTISPSQTGCSVILPKLDTCVSNPTQAGCSVVLPKLDSCVSNPTQTGCIVVLPKLDSCVSNPTQTGCSTVLPKLDSCVTNPIQQGCSVVLPKLDSCVTNPTQTGCTAVLPKFDACVTNPTQAGCSVVLPAMSTCTTAPSTAGCSAVLPSLSQCSTNPNLEGCSAVLPIAGKCTINPKAEGCETVLPNTGQNNGATEKVTETVTTTINTLVKTTNQSAANTESNGASSAGGTGNARPTEKSSDKGEDKKDEKRTTSSTDDSGAKKNEPVKKMYCN